MTVLTTLPARLADQLDLPLLDTSVENLDMERLLLLQTLAYRADVWPTETPETEEAFAAYADLSEALLTARGFDWDTYVDKCIGLHASPDDRIQNARDAVRKVHQV